MMRIIRVILAIAVITTSVSAAYRLCWMRFQCETDKYTLDRRLTRAFEAHDYTRHVVGRAAIPRLTECVAHDPSDYHARFLLGRAAEAADQKELALSAYESALALNERPEIYARIGLLHLEQGRYEEARQNLIRAVIFQSEFANAVSQPLRNELSAIAQARKARLNERARQTTR